MVPQSESISVLSIRGNKSGPELNRPTGCDSWSPGVKWFVEGPTGGTVSGDKVCGTVPGRVDDDLKGTIRV